MTFARFETVGVGDDTPSVEIRINPACVQSIRRPYFEETINGVDVSVGAEDLTKVTVVKMTSGASYIVENTLDEVDSKLSESAVE